MWIARPSLKFWAWSAFRLRHILKPGNNGFKHLEKYESQSEGLSNDYPVYDGKYFFFYSRRLLSRQIKKFETTNQPGNNVVNE